MEKVLFISNRLRPSNNAEAFQSTMIAKYLSVNCETHVLSTTEAPSDADACLHHFVPQKKDSSVGSKIERAYSRLGKDIRASFPDSHAGWVDDAAREAATIIAAEGIKIVITRSMPASSHLIGLKLKELHPEIRWIASMSDPISINPYQRYSSKGLESRIAAFEKEIFDKAETVTHSNSYAIEAYRRAYGSLPAKHIVLPNMFDRSPVEESRRIWSGAGPMVMTYAGRFYGHRTPEPLFKAMRLFLDSGRRLKLNIVGAGKSRRLDELVKKYRLSDNVELKPFMESENLGNELASSHLLVTIDADFPGDNIFLPSKNLDYLSLTIPILGITRKGPTAALIEETKSGFWAEPQDTKGILSILMAHSERVKQGYEFSPDHGKVMAYHSSAIIQNFWKRVCGGHGNQ